MTGFSEHDGIMHGIGITNFADTGFRNPLKLFDGLFVGDLDSEGNDVPELQFDVAGRLAAE